MALHTDLAIHTATRQLLSAVVNMVLEMRRDAKPCLGRLMLEETLEIATLIQRANMAEVKDPFILGVIEKKSRVELLLQTALDTRVIEPGPYALVIRHTESIGRQAIKWRRNSQDRQLHHRQGGDARA